MWGVSIETEGGEEMERRMWKVWMLGATGDWARLFKVGYEDGLLALLELQYFSNTLVP